MKEVAEPFRRFRRVVVEDFEFSTDSAGRPNNILAYCAIELGTGRKWREWSPKTERDPLGKSDLLVAFAAGAELGCRARLGWSCPPNVICLHAEYAREVAGLEGEQFIRRGLLDALRVFEITHPYESQKGFYQSRALDPRPFKPSEKAEMLNYCMGDVQVTVKLFEKLLRRGCWADPRLIEEALFRGRFVKAQRVVESNGIPIDRELWQIVESRREDLRAEFIKKMDVWGLYEAGIFKSEKFESFVRSLGCRWPKTPTGRFKKDEATLKNHADLYPAVRVLTDLQATMGTLRKAGVVVTPEGRSHPYTAPFKSKTGRNQPSTSRFIFGAPKWLRSLVKPPEGRALAYVDIVGEEFGLAALLSKDGAMWTSYESDDVYLSFARLAGLAPEGATKASHPEVRRLAKAVVLGVQYGQGHKSIAERLKISEVQSAQLIWAHQKAYPVFWKWRTQVEQLAFLKGSISTGCGWRMQVGTNTRATTIMNFPMQAAGADLMRAVTIRLIESGITLVAQVHDAFLIESGLEDICGTVHETQKIIAQTTLALFGKPLRTDSMIVRWPDRYIDTEALPMLRTLSAVLLALGGKDLLLPKGQDPVARTDRP